MRQQIEITSGQSFQGVRGAKATSFDVEANYFFLRQEGKGNKGKLRQEIYLIFI